MSNKVIAIGLDAAPPELIFEWMSRGELPHLKRLRDQGALASLKNIEYYKAETPWTTFLTGCLPEKTGYWAPIKLHEGTYSVEKFEAYDFSQYSPFYALGERYRVAAFDLPQSTLSENVNGVQVLGWGAHSPQTPSHSMPSELLGQLEDKHGVHPALHKDHGSWWDESYINRLSNSLKTGIERRISIFHDLFHQEPWDLFLTIFGETHSAGHDLWYLSQKTHPLYSHRSNGMPQGDPMLDVFKAVDTALGEMLAEAPDNTNVVVFSGHGSGDNTTDVTSMLFLPEFLYRFSFPGKRMLASGNDSSVVPPIITSSKDQNWSADIWKRRFYNSPVERFARKVIPQKFHRYLDPIFNNDKKVQLASSKELREQGIPYYWQPTMWFKPFWTQMQAFALPSFSEGYIRINLEGREPNGIVPLESYDAVCTQITEELHKLVDPRTGKLVVDSVIRTRSSGNDTNPNLPDADLVVKWSDMAIDVVDHPSFGRIGPVPYRRTGSHRARGFMIVKGPGIEAGTTLQEGHCVDLAPTILDLMGARIPEYFDGKSLIKLPLKV